MRLHLPLIKPLLFSIRAAGLMLALAVMSHASHAHAAFNAGAIIDDSRFVKQSMNAGDIQNWLNAVNSTCLKNATAPVPLGNSTYGGNVSIATVIAESARLNNLNPQVLIATLQKEQGLVTRTDCPAWRYDAAMGKGCPDSGSCSDLYRGIHKQLYEGARQLRNCFYQDKPGWWCSYIPYTTGTVKYNPNSACGSTQVYISNRATATLYTYTPYQPNPAVLGGHADGCSTFGNLNFVYYMDYWFPDPSSSGFSLIKASNSPNQYILQNSNGNLSIRLIPDPGVILAWGLDRVTLQTVDPSVVSGTPRAMPDLTRLSRPSGGLTVYFMDNGQRHPIPYPQMMTAWGLQAGDICDVSSSLGLVPTNGSDLAYATRSTDSSDQGIYMMDGTTLRQYQSPDTVMAWEGNNPSVVTITAGYLANFPKGAALTHSRFTDGSNQYLAESGRKFSLDSARSTLYPWTAQAVSAATLGRLSSAGPAPIFIQAAGDPAVYMLDAGARHHVTDPYVLNGWLAGQSVVGVSPGTVGLLPNATAITSYFADSGGQLYVLNGAKQPVPASLDSAFRTGQTVYAASSNLLSLLSTGSAPGQFIKGSAPSVFLLDSAGVRRPITSIARLQLWGGTSPLVTTVSDSLLAKFGAGTALTAFASDGTTEFVLDLGAKYPVSGGVKSDWGLSSPVTLPAATLGRFTTGSALTATAHAGPNYILISSGTGYATADANIADAWALTAAPAHSSALISELLPLTMLTRTVASLTPSDPRQFIVDAGKLYLLSPSDVLNLLQGPEPQAKVDIAAVSGGTTYQWDNTVVVKDAANKHYVIDHGTKRPFPSQTVQDYWTGNGALTVPQTTNGFLNLLPTQAHIERAVKSSDPAVYAVPSGQKRWILSSQTYNSSYAPYAVVSNQLLDELPNGPSIP